MLKQYGATIKGAIHLTLASLTWAPHIPHGLETTTSGKVWHRGPERHDQFNTIDRGVMLLDLEPLDEASRKKVILSQLFINRLL
jgi:hypothetical protein